MACSEPGVCIEETCDGKPQHYCRECAMLTCWCADCGCTACPCPTHPWNEE